MSYRDFEEFLESFNDAGVRYLVIGAHAVAFHARPRATCWKACYSTQPPSSPASEA